MMTLDEAIKHCNEVACKHDKCATEHKQLAQWLIELKGYRVSATQETQKATDKVEPKFHEGNWVLNNVCLPVQIASIKDSMYIFTDGCAMPVSFVDENYHLWTIQDAKDGDVLVASDGSIFLFAGVDDCACKYYVALTTDNYVKINKEAKGGYWETSRAVHPATKEQRDLLFQKMADAGYEFVNGHITRF